MLILVQAKTVLNDMISADALIELNNGGASPCRVRFKPQWLRLDASEWSYEVVSEQRFLLLGMVSIIWRVEFLVD